VHSFAHVNGSLRCGEVDLNEIADNHGTPAYVYSGDTIRGNLGRLQQALSPVDHLVCYAVKANSNLSILSLLAGLGAGFDIVSGGELHRVLKAGGRADRCTFAGVGKTRDEIAFALREGVYSFNVESEAELERINDVAASLSVKAPVAIRVNPDVDPKTHKFISTGKSHNKFGIGIDRAPRVYEFAASLPNLRIRGVQTHIGSQILEPGPFREAAGKLAALVEDLKKRHDLEFFDFGGGLGIVYDEALESGSPDWWVRDGGARRITPEDYAEAVLPLLQPLGLKILFEPGRFLVGNAGVLLATVQYLKQTPAKTFAIVDAAMNDLIRPALYEGWHQIVPLRPREGEASPVDVVGPVCESGDFFAQDRLMPPLRQNDRIAIMSSGAYGFVMASNYNSRPLPPEILVDGGDVRVARRRQTLDDLIAAELPVLDSAR
jgi:diaminopimelate decarboxylase